MLPRNLTKGKDTALARLHSTAQSNWPITTLCKIEDRRGNSSGGTPHSANLPSIKSKPTGGIDIAPKEVLRTGHTLNEEESHQGK